MMKKIRIAIGHYQVAFARRDVYARAEFRSGLAGGVDDKTRRENSAVSEARRPFSDRGDWLALDDASSQPARFLQEEVRGAGRVNDRISWHAQSARKRRAQMRFRFANLLRIEDFRVDAAFPVVIIFTADFPHFFFVGGNPERAAWVEFHGRWKLVAQIVPENLRITRDGELRFGIVHHDDVAHGCASGASAREAFVNYQDAQTFGGEFQGAGGADDAGTHDYDFCGFVHG